MILDQLWNEARLHCYQVRRYWQESIAAFAATMLGFAGLLYAVAAVGEVEIASGKLDGLIIGFVVWMFACSAYASIASEVADEIHQRSLEQLCIADLPLAAILALRAAIKFGAGTAMLVLMLGSVDLLLGQRIDLPYPATLAALLLAAPSLVGLGYAVAGVLLLARKAEAIGLLVYPAIIALVACPAYPVNPAALLPFCLGASAAKAAASGAVLAWSTYLTIAVNSVLWLLAGLLVFRWLERKARRLGVMGHI